MARGFTKAQKKTLSDLRALLRHVYKEVDSSTGNPLKRNVQPWVSYIMGEYRANQELKDKRRIKSLRQVTQDYLKCALAVKEQKSLYYKYGGADADSREYREAAARRVGVELPQRPLPIKESDFSR